MRKGIKISENGVFLAIKVTPKAGLNAIVGWENEELKIKLAAVPEKGEANRELVAYLATFFHVAKSRIEVISGQMSRHKKIFIQGITEEEVKEKLLK